MDIQILLFFKNHFGNAEKAIEGLTFSINSDHFKVSLPRSDLSELKLHTI